MMDYVSIIGDVLHVVIAAPLLGVGIVIGAIGYRYLLKNEPSLLNSLVSAAYTDLQAALKALEAKAGAAVMPTPATTTAAAPTSAAPAAVVTTAVDAAAAVTTTAATQVTDASK
jgi:cytochrome bd-type quinol oxidase subunit 1